MRLVIDTNRIIASLIKEGVSRNILFDKKFEFISPDFTLIEISKYKFEIIEKISVSEEEFGLLIQLLFEKITIISKEEYLLFMEEASRLIKDQKDVPFLALALSKSVEGIWSDDSDFKQQSRVNVFTTSEMLKI